MPSCLAGIFGEEIEFEVLISTGYGQDDRLTVR
jgi:hypothetical protein